ncbi:MAG: multiple cyclophane-containing RiPP AmcA [Pseudonocardiaceae bacterium]
MPRTATSSAAGWTAPKPTTAATARSRSLKELGARQGAGELLESYERCTADKWDNRPVWDNWNKKPEKPFDNRPTWDNWDKR